MSMLDGLTFANTATIQRAFDVAKGKRKEIPLHSLLRHKGAASILEEAGITIKDLRALARADGKSQTVSQRDFVIAKRTFQGLREASVAFVFIRDGSNPRIGSNFCLIIGKHPNAGEALPDELVEDNRTLPENLDGQAHGGIGYLSVFRISKEGLALLKTYERKTPGNSFERLREAFTMHINAKYGGKTCLNCGGIFDLEKADIQTIIAGAK